MRGNPRSTGQRVAVSKATTAFLALLPASERKLWEGAFKGRADDLRAVRQSLQAKDRDEVRLGILASLLVTPRGRQIASALLSSVSAKRTRQFAAGRHASARMRELAKELNEIKKPTKLETVDGVPVRQVKSVTPSTSAAARRASKADRSSRQRTKAKKPKKPRMPVRQIREVQALCRALEDDRLTSAPTGAAAAVPLDTVSLHIGQARVRVTKSGERSFFATIRVPDYAGEDIAVRVPADWRWSGGGARRRWMSTHSEAVGAAVCDAVATMLGTGDVTVTIDGQELRPWIAERRSEKALVVASRTSFDELPDVRGASVEDDSVLGSVATPEQLTLWLAAVGSAARRQQRLMRGQLRSNAVASPMAAGSISRIEAGDVPGFMALIAARSAPAEAEPSLAWAADALLESQPMFVEARVAAALFESESVPSEWLNDIRLSYPLQTVVLSAGFRLPESWCRRLPSSPVGEGAVAGHRADFDELRRSARLHAVTLVSEDDGRLARYAAVHLAWGEKGAADGLVSVPVIFRDALVAGVVYRLAAWLSQPSIARRYSKARGGERHGAGMPDNGEDGELGIVPIRPVRTARHSSSRGTSGGRRAHVRRGHWRRVRVGPRDDWEYEVRWIPPTWVGEGGPGDDRNRVYRLPDRF